MSEPSAAPASPERPPLPSVPSVRSSTVTSDVASDVSIEEGTNAAVFRDRLIRFYTHYNAGALSSVNAITTMYAGREEELMRVLEQKYGAEEDIPGEEPSVAPPPAAEEKKPRHAAADERGSTTSQSSAIGVAAEAVAARSTKSSNSSPPRTPREVTAKPNAVTPSDAVSDVSTGSNPTSLPAIDPKLRERVAAFYKHYNPSKVAEVDAIMEAFRAHPDRLMHHLIKKYGPEPGTVERSSDEGHSAKKGGSGAGGDKSEGSNSLPSSPSRRAVQQSFGNGSMDSLGGEEVADYTGAGSLPPRAPSPHSSTAASEKAAAAISATSAPTADATPQSPKDLDWATRFHNFFAYYRPEKLSRLPEKLAAHSGREEEWMGLLIKKYGSEPPPRKPLVRQSGSRSGSRAATPPRNNSITGESIRTPSAAHSVAGTSVSEQPSMTPPPSSVAPTHVSLPRRASRDPIAELEFRARLVSFFQFHNPALVDHVDRLLEEDETDLFRKLVERYGPEPSRTEGRVAAAVHRIENQNQQQQPPGGFLSPQHDAGGGPGGEVKLGLKTSKEVVQFLRSPSPPQEPLRQAANLMTTNQLGYRLQEPGYTAEDAEAVDRIKDDHAVIVKEYEEVVAKLSEALELKTAELQETLASIQQKDIHTEAVETAAKGQSDELTAAQGRIAELTFELETANKSSEAKDAKIKEAEETAARANEAWERAAGMAEEAQAQRDSLQHVVSTQNMSESTEVDRLKSTVAVREHQLRMLRMQFHQVNGELVTSEARLDKTQKLNRELQSKVTNLLKENAALQLEMTPQGNPERFYEVVQDLQGDFKAHYEKRIDQAESELRDYYEHAREQVKNRDILVEELSAKIAEETTAKVEALEAEKQRLVELGTKEEEKGLAREIGQLKTQLAVQQEEHKALLQLLQARGRGELIPPPTVRSPSRARSSMGGIAADGTNTLTSGSPDNTLLADDMSQYDVVRQLKQQALDSEAEARAAKSALNAELARQVAELSKLHERVTAQEAEKDLLRSQLTEAMTELQATSGARGLAGVSTSRRESSVVVPLTTASPDRRASSLRPDYSNLAALLGDDAPIGTSPRPKPVLGEGQLPSLQPAVGAALAPPTGDGVAMLTTAATAAPHPYISETLGPIDLPSSHLDASGVGAASLGVEAMPSTSSRDTMWSLLYGGGHPQ